jgi:hypothetical protein
MKDRAMLAIGQRVLTDEALDRSMFGQPKSNPQTLFRADSRLLKQLSNKTEASVNCAGIGKDRPSRSGRASNLLPERRP